MGDPGREEVVWIIRCASDSLHGQVGGDSATPRQRGLRATKVWLRCALLVLAFPLRLLHEWTRRSIGDSPEKSVPRRCDDGCPQASAVNCSSAASGRED